MKKILVVAVLALFGFSLHAQEGFKAGANVGLPVGDAADFSSFSIGVDVVYHWEVADSFTAGIASGFTNAIGKKINDFKIDDIQFLPVAASGRFLAGENFSFGADLGYAIGISEDLDGGFYYRPLVGYAIGSDMELNVSYTGISLEGMNWTTINLGVLFTL